jgi:NifU-like protein involved in Fe-S cluster formation
MSDIYTSRIIELASDIHFVGPLIEVGSGPIGQSLKASKICGSQIEVSVQLDAARQKIVSFGIVPKACALGQASAAILSHHIIGGTIDEVIAARDELRNMLKHSGAAPSGRFWELRHLETVIDYPARHASTMLAWEATASAIEMALSQI